MHVKTPNVETGSAGDERLVRSERVIPALTELAKSPEAANLQAMARITNTPRPTVHRAFASLSHEKLACSDGRGHNLSGGIPLFLAIVGGRLDAVL